MIEGLTDSDLKEMGIASLGERKKLLLLIENTVGSRGWDAESGKDEFGDAESEKDEFEDDDRGCRPVWRSNGPRPKPGQWWLVLC